MHASHGSHLRGAPVGPRVESGSTCRPNQAQTVRSHLS